MDVPIARYSIVQLAPLFFSNNEIDESVGNLFCASRADESKKPKIFKNGRSYRPLFNCKAIAPCFFQTTRQTKVLGTFFVRLAQMNPKNQKFLKMDVPIARYSIVQLATCFFQTTRQTKVLGTFFVRLAQLNPKNQKFLKMDVPIARYSIVQYCHLFSSNNEIDESVGNLFCASRADESKKPKIFKNGRSYRPLFNCKAIATCFSSNNEIDESVGNLFCASRAAESKKPKIFKNGRSYRPLFNCIAIATFFFKQRDRRKCWEPFLCVSSS